MRTMLHTTCLLLLVTLSLASRLSLHGSGSDIIMNDAILTASCANARMPKIRLLDVSGVRWGFSDPGTITAWLINVPTTCIDKEIDEPCASQDSIEPALFFCHYRGQRGLATAPHPVRAEVLEVNVGSTTVGLQPVVKCPIPLESELKQALAIDGSDNGMMNLSITQCARPDR